MGAKDIVDYPFLRNQICGSDVIMPHMILTHKLPCSAITDAAQHFTKLWQSYNFGIVSKAIQIVFSVFYKISPLKKSVVNDGRGWYNCDVGR